MATIDVRRKVILAAALMVGYAVVCCGNMMDELESGYFDREYSLTKPYAGDGRAQAARVPTAQRKCGSLELLFLSAGQNWDMGGITVVTPDYVRLTPDRQSTRGSIWNRVVSAPHAW